MGYVGQFLTLPKHLAPQDGRNVILATTYPIGQASDSEVT